eukprot:5191780-Prymnesium_polylepis.1
MGHRPSCVPVVLRYTIYDRKGRKPVMGSCEQAPRRALPASEGEYRRQRNRGKNYAGASLARHARDQRRGTADDALLGLL